MLKKVKEFIDSIKRKNAQKKEMKSMQDYYEKLRAGALFVQYIYKDIETQKKKMNIHQKQANDFIKQYTWQILAILFGVILFMIIYIYATN